MDKKEKVLNNLRRQCSRREYSSSDILKKAQKALDDDKVGAKDILTTLMEEGYVDDLRYASAYARDKSSISGWGEHKIRCMLTSKGIDRETIDRALEEIDQNKAGHRLEKLIENKYRSLVDDPQWRMKLLRFAMGRGYSYDMVCEIIDRYKIQK